MDNKNIIKTPHIVAKADTFTKVVLMPGDPARAKMIADTYLTNVEVISDVRGIKAYKGNYKSDMGYVKLTVMASGMGMPSIGIYSHELFNLFGVEMIIRIGTAGGIQENLNIGDIIIAQAACTNSNYTKIFSPDGVYAPISDFEMTLEMYINSCKNGHTCYVGNVLSSDVFYNNNGSDSWKKLGVLAVEMEAAALFTEAAKTSKKAAAICTISDLVFDESKNMTAEQRQNSLHKMIKIALDSSASYAIKYNRGYCDE